MIPLPVRLTAFCCVKNVEESLGPNQPNGSIEGKSNHDLGEQGVARGLALWSGGRSREGTPYGNS